MFSIITIASSTTKPVEMVSAISVRLLRLNPAKYIAANVPTSESGTATAGNQRGREPPEEQEDHRHDQRDRQHQLELHIGNRGSDRRRAISENGDVDRRRQRVRELRQERLDAIDDGDGVRGRLALHVHDDGRRRVHPGGLAHVFDAVDDVGHVREAHRGAILVGHDQRAVRRARCELIVGVDGVRLVRTVEGAFGLIGVCRRNGVA